MEKWSSRKAHNLEIVGSIPTGAILGIYAVCFEREAKSARHERGWVSEALCLAQNRLAVSPLGWTN